MLARVLNHTTGVDMVSIIFNLYLNSINGWSTDLINCGFAVYYFYQATSGVDMEVQDMEVAMDLAMVDMDQVTVDMDIMGK